MIKKHAILVGTFPPPVHGMAAANQAVQERLVADGWLVHRLNTSPLTLSRTVMARLGRFPMVLRAWFYLINFYLKKENQKTVTYVSLSGGWGQLYDLITVFLSKLMGAHIVMHHHSFFYLDNYRILSNCVFKVAGKGAGHVVLCNKMREALEIRYQVQNVLVLSNVVLFPIDEQFVLRTELRCIGFLSNITQEKGGDIVIKLARAIKKREMPLSVIIAGPCHDEKLKSELLKAGDEGIIQWTGAVYGKNKARFWAEIDAFIFPTQYENEAEPLVLWEALAAGVPIIAYNRGCIAEQAMNAGVVVPTNEDFIAMALPVLETWIQNQESYQAALLKSCHYYGRKKKEYGSDWKNFKLLLLNGWQE
jgi:glycosyltransferase involved in cell wall biosynthesis